MSTQSQDLALAIIDFLRTSVSKGEVAEDFGESVDVAIDCIADAYGVDKDAAKDTVKTKFNGQGLLELVQAVSSSKVPVNIPEEDTELKAKAEALKLEGNRAIARKDFTEAVEKYTAALELIPDNAVYLSNRAAAYSSSRQHELAAADAERAIASDPTYAKAYSRLGLAKFALGDAKSAMEAYKAGIEAEGDKPSDSMKKGYETAKSRVQSELEASLDTSSNDSAVSRDTPSTSSAGSGADASGAGAGAGAGGLPDFSNLASMLGGAGGGGLAGLMNNPQIMQAAQQMMSNPDAMAGLMNNPALRQMAQNFGLGGGAAGAGAGANAGTGARAAEDSSSSSGEPDLSELLNNPMLANLANQFMGGRNSGN